MTRKKKHIQVFLGFHITGKQVALEDNFSSLGKGLLTQQTKKPNHILANISTTVFTRSAYLIFWEVDPWHIVCAESESQWSCEAYKR